MVGHILKLAFVLRYNVAPSDSYGILMKEKKCGFIDSLILSKEMGTKSW